MITKTFKIKDGRNSTTQVISTPTEHGAAVAEYSLMIISLLGWNQEFRETLGEMCLDTVLIGMKVSDDYSLQYSPPSCLSES